MSAEKLFDDSHLPITIGMQIHEIKREIGLRRGVYPRFIEQGKLTERQASEQIAILEAALGSLEQIEKFEEHLGGEIHFNSPLMEIREYLRKHYEKGVQCPACKQNVEIHTHAFNKSMARNLRAIYAETLRLIRSRPAIGFCGDVLVDVWINVPELLLGLGLNRSNDAGFMRHWNVIEAKPGEREDGSTRTGIYRITQCGIDFVEGRISIRKYIRRYNGKTYRCDDETEITFEQALGEPFNYRQFQQTNAAGEEAL